MIQKDSVLFVFIMIGKQAFFISFHLNIVFMTKSMFLLNFRIC